MHELENPFRGYWMQPQVVTSTYYELPTVSGVVVISGWDAGPLGLPYDQLPVTRGRVAALPIKLGELRAQVLEPNVLVEQQYGAVGRLAGSGELEGELIPVSAWLKGPSEKEVMRRLWEKYRFVVQ